MGVAASKRVPLGALLAAQAVSVTGNRIALLAIPWFVLQTTGDAGKTGIAAAMNTIPAIVAGLLAGPLIERAGYRTTSITADVASGATIAAIPALYLADLLSYPLLLVLVFLGALLDAPGETARRSLLPDLADHAGVSIDRATSLHETTYRTTQLIGAPLGGVLIATIGAAEALAVDAFTFAISALLVGLLVRIPQPAAATPSSETAGYVTDLAAGWRFLLGHPLLRSVVAVFIGANVLENGLVQVLLPTLADRVYGKPIVLGLLVGAIGAGGLIGVAMHAVLTDRLSRRSMLVAAFALAGAPKFLMLAVLPSAAMAVFGMVMFAIASGPINPISGAIQYELIPKDMRGRVFGLLAVAFIGAAPIGALGTGFLTEIIGLRPTLLTAAALYTVLALVPVLHPQWQDLDDLAPQRLAPREAS